MRDVSFIADVAVLPRWIRVSQLLDYVGGVHPKFDRAKAEGFLAKTIIKRTSKVRQLSKGMVAQLHLAIVMAIDAKLLVLDEPTLGLDILYRKQFYDSLLNDYFDKTRTIVVTTHQVEEVQDVLTDLMFIERRVRSGVTDPGYNTPLGFQGQRRRLQYRSTPTALLVGVAGVVGEPLYIYSTAERRGGRALWVHDQHLRDARAPARGVVDGSGKAAGNH